MADEAVEVKQVEPSKTFESHFVDTPYEVFEHFGVQPVGIDNDTKQSLKDISEWAFMGNSVSDGLSNLRSLEMTLGAPRFGEKSYTKVARWVKLQRSINELRKRQEAV